MDTYLFKLDVNIRLDYGRIGTILRPVSLTAVQNVVEIRGILDQKMIISLVEDMTQ